MMEMEGATSADTSYGMTELPDECEVKEGGGVNCARDVCDKKRKQRKARDRSKKRMWVRSEWRRRKRRKGTEECRR